MTETLTKEVFIPLKIDTKAGRRPNVIKPDDYFARTHLVKLLARARILEDQLIKRHRNLLRPILPATQNLATIPALAYFPQQSEPKNKEGHRRRLRPKTP